MSRALLIVAFLSTVSFAETVVLVDGFVPDKYGIVRVYNDDSTINREYRITGRQLSDFRAEVSSVPVGTTPREWNSGNTIVMGKGFEVGDMHLARDGWLKIKYAETVVNGRFDESFVSVGPGEWSGTYPDVTVLKSRMDLINAEESRRTRTYKRNVDSIAGGILETK